MIIDSTLEFWAAEEALGAAGTIVGATVNLGVRAGASMKEEKDDPPGSNKVKWQKGRGNPLYVAVQMGQSDAAVGTSVQWHLYTGPADLGVGVSLPTKILDYQVFPLADLLAETWTVDTPLPISNLEQYVQLQAVVVAAADFTAGGFKGWLGFQHGDGVGINS